ncbi:hypothetical protein ACLOJK_025567 [Asimina triloba]
MQLSRVPAENGKNSLKATVLEKKKAIDESIKAACSEKDHLASFPAFRQYDRNGLSIYLESDSGEHLSSHMKRYIQNLLKIQVMHCV